MKSNSEKDIVINIVVDESFAIINNEKIISLLPHKLEEVLTNYIASLGINVTPKVDVLTTGLNAQVMQVFVQGMRQRCFPEIMRRILLCDAIHKLQKPESWSEINSSDPFELLKNYLGEIYSEDENSRNNIIDFLTDLVSATIQEQPSCLLSVNAVDEYINRSGEPIQASAELVETVLKHLLDQGMSITDNSDIMNFINQSYKLEMTGSDISELLFARKKQSVMEFISSPDDFMILVKDDMSPEIADEIIPVYSDTISQSVRDEIKLMEEGLFWELGIYAPDFIWKIDNNLPPGRVAIRINDRIINHIALLDKGKILVNETPTRLDLYDVKDSSATVNPVTGRPCSFVPSSYKKLLEDAGYTTWENLGYFLLRIGGEIKRLAPKVFSVNDSLFHFVKIRENYPELIKRVMRKTSIEDITCVFRALLAEGLTIRDMRSILEILLQYDTIQADSNQMIVFDERLPIRSNSSVLHANSWRSYYEFVRSGLKRQISSKLLGSQNSIPVLLLDPKLEDWLIENNMSDAVDLTLLEEKRYAIQQAIWSEIRQNSILNPIILTTREPRASLKEIICSEMPNVTIIAYSELTTDISLETISRITLPEDVSQYLRH